MKKMFMLIVSTIIILLIIVIIIFNSIKNNLKKLDSEVTKIENNIGKKVILGNDTILITDYSLFNSNYTLSNGNKISFKLVEKLKILN